MGDFPRKKKHQTRPDVRQNWEPHDNPGSDAQGLFKDHVHPFYFLAML